MCMRMCTSYVLPRHVTNARMCPIFKSCMCMCVFVPVCMSVCMYVCGHACLWVCVCARLLASMPAFTHVSPNVYYMRTIHVRPYTYMWHMMTTSLDHDVQQMRAVQGLKAARWQRQTHPSGACTLCSRAGSRTHAENASRAAAHFRANRRLLVNRQNGHPEAPPYHLAHPAPWRRL